MSQCFICHYSGYYGPLRTHQQPQQDMLLLLMQRDTRAVVGFTTVLKQVPQSQLPFLPYATHAMSPPQLGFPFRVKPPPSLSLYISVCYGVCLFFSGSKVGAIFTYQGSNVGVCTTAALWSIPLAGICSSW